MTENQKAAPPGVIDEGAWRDEFTRLVAQLWTDLQAQFGPQLTPDLLKMFYSTALGRAFEEIDLPLQVVGGCIEVVGPGGRFVD